MTEQATDTTEPVDQGQAEHVEDQDQSTAPPSPTNREAAKYRIRLRETEAQLSATTERLNRIERGQVEALAAAHLAVPSDLFDLGAVNLDDLRDEDGDIDPEKVEAAAKDLLTRRPGLAAVPVVRHVSFDGGPRSGPASPPSPTYTDVLRGAQGGQ